MNVLVLNSSEMTKPLFETALRKDWQIFAPTENEYGIDLAQGYSVQTIFVGIDGTTTGQLEALKDFLSFYEDIPVIAILSEGSDLERAQALELGAEFSLISPFDSLEVEMAISTATRQFQTSDISNSTIEEELNYERKFTGSSGNDEITISDVSQPWMADIFYGHGGDDTIFAGAGDDYIDGGSGNDIIDAGSGSDIINGGSGNDKIYGKGGNDQINGGEGNDIIRGGSGDDSIFGGSGTDTMNGEGGNDTLTSYSNGGNILGGKGDDTIHAGRTGEGQYHIWGNAGDDTLNLSIKNLEPGWNHQAFHVYGGSGSDIFRLKDIDDVSRWQVLRLDDFQYGVDQLLLEHPDTGESISIDLMDLEASRDQYGMDAFGGVLRVVMLDGQQWLQVGNNTFVALEGARLAKYSDPLNPKGKPEKIEGTDINNDGIVNDSDAALIPFSLENTQEVHFTYLEFFLDVDDAKKVEISEADPLKEVAFENQMNWLDPTLITAGNSVSISVPEGADFADVLVNTGSSSDDYIFVFDRASSQYDQIDGGHGNDVIETGKGDDIAFGGKGNDTIAGGQDADTLYGGAGNDIIYGGSEDDVIWGDDVANRLVGNDILYGGAGNDDIYGGKYSDFLSGGRGNDNLNGGNGRDVLIGGEGFDKLTGGYGADTFVFDKGFGNNWILDFRQSANDKIAIMAGTGIESFLDLTTNHLGQNRLGEARITDGNGTYMLLQGISKDSFLDTFTQTDFIFGAQDYNF